MGKVHWTYGESRQNSHPPVRGHLPRMKKLSRRKVALSMLLVPGSMARVCMTMRIEEQAKLLYTRMDL